MNKYDTVIIFRDEIDEDYIKEYVYNNIKCINSYNYIGRKELAYKIAGQKFGKYVEVLWEGFTNDIKYTENEFKISDIVLKYITMNEWREFSL